MARSASKRCEGLHKRKNKSDWFWDIDDHRCWWRAAKAVYWGAQGWILCAPWDARGLLSVSKAESVFGIQERNDNLRCYQARNRSRSWENIPLLLWWKGSWVQVWRNRWSSGIKTDFIWENFLGIRSIPYLYEKDILVKGRLFFAVRGSRFL